MKNKYFTLISVLFILFNSFYFYGQTYSNKKDYYKWFDSIIGVESMNLYDGVEYEEKYKTINGNHKYYKSSQFLIGDIRYDGQSYYNIEMRYDIYDDDVIVKLPNQSNFFIVSLKKGKIENFSISNRHFIKVITSKKGQIKGISTFYETIFQSELLTLFKKHKKFRNERLDKSFVYSVFKEKNEFYLYLNNQYYHLKSKKDLIHLFPKQKKEINKFYNSNKVLQNSDYDMFIKLLMRQLEQLS